MKVTGKITKIDYVKFEGKDGREWEKAIFILITNEEYNNTYPMSVFGIEKASAFKKNVKLGQEVEVSFNVRTWESDNGIVLDKHFDAWNIKPLEQTHPEPEEDKETDDLPF